MREDQPVEITLADGFTSATLHPGCEYVVRTRLDSQRFDRDTA